ncbi:hypothetical protein AX15_004830 [Amanita polypyramis BW_CC]|nr:hypothetical protein AX15_004830 [Amanita polypyramis BW_CC]
MALVREYASGPPRSQQPLLLIQSSIAQSGVPLLRHIIAESTGNRSSAQCLVFCLLYQPSDLIEENASSDCITVYNWLEFVPGYSVTSFSAKDRILQTTQEAPPGQLNVVIDSIDTLLQDNSSPADVYKFVWALLSHMRQRSHPARLVIHVHQSSELLSILTQVSLSPSLVYLTAHPPALLIHVAKDYLTPPPPSSGETKFWSVFLPVRDRLYESINLVYGPRGEGSGSSSELVVEVLVRGTNRKGKRGIPRVLEAWSSTRREACELASLESLRDIWRKVVEKEAPDPRQNVSFNLTLTSSQQELKAQVPLPYTLDGRALQHQTGAAILYEPDSADDIDDDDPDEDLDI